MAKDDDLLTDARKRLAACISDEATERAKMLDDLRFCTLDQWPADVRKARENDPEGPRPCLTVDKVNQYIVQVVNDMRQNRPSIKIRPVDDAADVDTAKIFQGLTRHIEDASNASIAYETAGESQTRVGFGYFRVTTQYVDDKTKEQEIVIQRIPNAFSVYLGPHTMPDGSDAEFGFIFESIPKETFKRQYPKAKVDSKDFDDLGDTPTWYTEENVTVAEYFYTEFSDGEREDGTPTKIAHIKWVKMTGAEVIDRRDWAGKYVPIIEVIGREAYVDGKRTVWGLVRPVKDTLRLNNYWKSAMTERIALAPKTPFIGAVGQFKGVEDRWKKANVSNAAYLEYQPIDVNGNVVERPKRVEPAQIEVAMVQMCDTIERDVMGALGMFKSSLGEVDTSQQSGKAILALQRESDTGTLHFSDNLSISIRHCGRILVDLIPKIYDTRRILRILGEDGQPQQVIIDPQQQQAARKITDSAGKVRSIYNLGVGKYDVTVSVGPSYTTARQEAATVLTELANSAKDPVSASVMRYLAIKHSDFYGSDETLRMLKALLPPSLQQGDNEEPIPAQALAKMQQMGMQLQQMQQAVQQIGAENQQLKTQAQVDQTKVLADHDAKMKALELRKAEQDAELLLQRQKAEAEIQLKAWIADQEIAIKRQVAEVETANDTRTMEHKQLCERIDHVCSLMQQFEVASNNMQGEHDGA